MAQRSPLLSALGFLTTLTLLAAACGEAPPKPGGDNPNPGNPPGEVPGEENPPPPPPPPPPALTASAGQPQGLCSGGSATLTGSATGGVPPYTYLWSPVSECPGCIENPTDPVAIVRPQFPTTFRLRVTDSVGATAISEVAADVWAPPQPGPLDEQFLAPGEGAVLNGALPDTTAAWSCNREDCALSDPLGAQPTASPLNSTTYSVQLTDARGCLSAPTTVTVWVDLLLVSSLPADGAEGWPSTALLQLEFDRPLRAESVNPETVRLHDAVDGSPLEAELSLSDDGKVLYVEPGSGYDRDRDYTLTLVGGAAGLQSDDPVLPNRLRQDVVLSFSTGKAPDSAPPSIVSQQPLPDQTHVPQDTQVVIVFDELLDARTVNTTTVRLSGGQGDVSGAVHYDAASLTLTFSPGAPLEDGTTYTVHLDGLADLSGNTLSRRWSFSVDDSADEVPPQVVSITPADQEVEVTANTRVQVEFDELVDASTLEGLVVTNTLTGEPVSGTVSYSDGDKRATWTPTTLLAGLTSYTVSVAGVKDLAGNTLAAPVSSVFTTRNVLLADDFEAGLGNWTVGGTWATVEGASHDGSVCLTDSPGVRYGPSSDTDVTLTVPLDVSGASVVTVDFWRRLNAARGDWLFVEYRLSTPEVVGAWTAAGGYTGNGGWRQESLSVETQGNTWFELRLRFSTDGWRQRDGIYVDGLLLQSLAAPTGTPD